MARPSRALSRQNFKTEIWPKITTCNHVCEVLKIFCLWYGREMMSVFTCVFSSRWKHCENTACEGRPQSQLWKQTPAPIAGGRDVWAQRSYATIIAADVYKQGPIVRIFSDKRAFWRMGFFLTNGPSDKRAFWLTGLFSVGGCEFSDQRTFWLLGFLTNGPSD